MVLSKVQPKCLRPTEITEVSLCAVQNLVSPYCHLQAPKKTYKMRHEVSQESKYHQIVKSTEAVLRLPKAMVKDGLRCLLWHPSLKQE